MTHEFKFYIPSQPSNMTMYVIVVVAGVSISEGARMAIDYVKQNFPNAEPDQHRILDYAE